MSFKGILFPYKKLYKEQFIIFRKQDLWRLLVKTIVHCQVVQLGGQHLSLSLCREAKTSFFWSNSGRQIDVPPAVLSLTSV